jgi:hypothetical protein
VSELFGQLAQSTQQLVRQEATLAKAELRQAATDTGMAVAKIAAGTLVLYAGMLVLLFAAVAGLHEADLSWWASALIVGGVTLLVGLILLLRARTQLGSVSFVPRQTVATLKEDAAWAKGQVR